MASDARQPRAEDEFAVLTDGVIVLQCLDEDDAEAHLAGEDGDQIRWLAGGPASMERLLPWIRESREHWKSKGPRRHFGIRDLGTHQLIGNAEANLQLKGLTAGEVNISYAVFPKWRGQGIAKRAVLLICEWLSADPRYTKAIIRVEPENAYSHGVPRAAGFTEVGFVTSPDGKELVYHEKLLNCR